MQKLSFHFLTDFSFRDCNILHQIIKVHDHRDINYTKDHVEICIEMVLRYLKGITLQKWNPATKPYITKQTGIVTGVKKNNGINDPR